MLCYSCSHDSDRAKRLTFLNEDLSWWYILSAKWYFASMPEVVLGVYRPRHVAIVLVLPVFFPGSNYLWVAAVQAELHPTDVSLYYND